MIAATPMLTPMTVSKVRIFLRNIFLKTITLPQTNHVTRRTSSGSTVQ
jgi:hypothetical protein